MAVNTVIKNYRMYEYGIEIKTVDYITLMEMIYSKYTNPHLIMNELNKSGEVTLNEIYLSEIK